MPLTSGTKLGPYEIQSQLGAGGMGEVYKATDTRLERTVAIKVLPEHVASDPQAKQRFEREARTIAALNHPHICTLYDIGEAEVPNAQRPRPELGRGPAPSADSIQFLVMEYLEGETLAQRLMKGALPLDQLLRYATQIADALDKAHRHGITHRDLKPGNVMLTKAGAKLLDFGLARSQPPTRATSLSSLSRMPTQEAPLTEKGTILGTFQYMAPEQLEGKTADARTDIFAFGTVVYETATGRRAFEADSQAGLIGAILERQPVPISEVHSELPLALDRVVRKCLAKDPDDRWSSAHDLADELRWIAEGGSHAGVTAPVVVDRQSHAGWAWSLAAVLGAAAVALAIPYVTRAPADERAVRFTIATEAEPRFHLALSPDGRYLAYVARPDGERRLWVRPLDSLDAHPLPGTEGAAYPFWSPDSDYLAYFSEIDKKLKKVPVAGGAPQILCDVGVSNRGGTWSREGVIVFGSDREGLRLSRVSAAGGVATPVTTEDEAAQQFVHSWPQFLPDDRHFFYLVSGLKTSEANGIYVGSLDSADTERILNTAHMARFTPPGHLLFVQGEALMAQPFDVDALQLIGEPVTVAEQVATDAQVRLAGFSVSETGSLVYRSGVDFGESQLVWFDRAGRRTGSVGEPGSWGSPTLSPDGTKVAVVDTNDNNIWLLDTVRGTQSRFTFDFGNWPMWSPDGQLIAFGAAKDGGPVDLYQRDAAGASEEELLLATDTVKVLHDWSADGRFLSYFDANNETAYDLWVFPLFGNRQPMPFLQTAAREIHPEFSPDGKWIAYASNETGQYEVYVQPFPPTGGKWQISTSSGLQPKWRGDGNELFYLSEQGYIMGVDLNVGTVVESGTPHPLFEVRTTIAFERNSYDVTPDGQRFLVNSLVLDSGASPVTVVLNWAAGFQR